MDELASHRQWWRAPLELQRTYPQCERHHDRFEARQEEQHAEEVLVLRPEQRRRTVVACRGSPPFQLLGLVKHEQRQDYRRALVMVWAVA